VLFNIGLPFFVNFESDILILHCKFFIFRIQNMSQLIQPQLLKVKKKRKKQMKWYNIYH